MKMSDIVVDGLYSNGKSDRYYSERRVLSIKVNERYSKLSQVSYEIVNGYVSHTLADGKGVMTLEAFAKWAAVRLDIHPVIPVHALVIECKCGTRLEAGYHIVGQTVDVIDCDCGLEWTIPQPRCVDKREKSND